jgi:hypothetical protein
MAERPPPLKGDEDKDAEEQKQMSELLTSMQGKTHRCHPCK